MACVSFCTHHHNNMARKRHMVLRHGTFTEVGVHHTQQVCGSQQVSKGAPSLRPRSAHSFRSVMLERSCAPEEDRRYISGSTWFQVPSRDVSDQSPDHRKGAEAASGKATAAPHPLPSLWGASVLTPEPLVSGQEDQWGAAVSLWGERLLSPSLWSALGPGPPLPLGIWGK